MNGTGATPGATPLPVIRVACGVLCRADGQVLLAQRPAGKLAAGCWEFPGGKIESGESAEAALRRELLEELGIVVTALEPLIEVHHRYRDREVWLDTWRVLGWHGELAGREGQALHWCPPQALGVAPCLPTVAGILPALRLPSHYVFTPAEGPVEAWFADLPRLPAGALLRLRQPALTEAEYADLARRLQPAARAQGLRLVLDRAAALSEALGCEWHARAAVWQAAGFEPPPGLIWHGSAHGREELLTLRRLGAASAVLGPVQATPTHPGQAALGWAAFARAVRGSNLPCFALGGVGPAQRQRALAEGGQGVAGIRAYWSAPDREGSPSSGSSPLSSAGSAGSA